MSAVQHIENFYKYALKDPFDRKLVINFKDTVGGTRKV